MNRITGIDLLREIQALTGAHGAIDAQTVDLAPAERGAYALMMHLAAPVPLSRGRAGHVLAPGWYVYAGSAHGPGGIRGRLRHHFRRDKKMHWHVDALTVAADSIHATMVAGGSECAIVAGLIRSPGFRFPLPGFGSSDCSCCSAHLLECCVAR